MAKTYNINYLSDFKILETLPKKQYNNIPFVWIYSGANGNEYSASFDGQTYKNCIKVSDTQIMVLFKDHNLGIGKVSVTRKWKVTDTDFSDDLCNTWSSEDTSVVLGRFPASDVIANNSFVPAYVKGDRGPKGEKGDDGASIVVSSEITSNGHLLIHYTDSQSTFGLDNNGHLIITL